MEVRQEEKKEFKVKDTRIFSNPNMNDLPTEEIPVPDEKKPLSVKLREEKDRKINKKELRLKKKIEKQPAKQLVTFKCPACKYTAPENKFLHSKSKEASFSACTNCGNLFVPMSHIRYAMKAVKLRENKGIIVPGG